MPCCSTQQHIVLVCAGVAFLESKFNLDLQHAMLLVPTAYALSGIAFYGAEAVMKNEKALNGSTTQ